MSLAAQQIIFLMTWCGCAYLHFLDSITFCSVLYVGNKYRIKCFSRFCATQCIFLYHVYCVYYSTSFLVTTHLFLDFGTLIFLICSPFHASFGTSARGIISFFEPIKCWEFWVLCIVFCRLIVLVFIRMTKTCIKWTQLSKKKWIQRLMNRHLLSKFKYNNTKEKNQFILFYFTFTNVTYLNARTADFNDFGLVGKGSAFETKK